MMITIRKSDIPDYLQRGELYQTLVENNDDPDEELTFPENVLKPDTVISNTKDCDHLLSSLRFWGVECPKFDDLVEYVLSFPGPTTATMLKKYQVEFPLAKVLYNIAAAQHGDRMKRAIASGRVDLVERLAEKSHTYPDNACNLAAKAGSLEIMSHLRHVGCEWSQATGIIAAKHGRIDVLEHFYTYSQFSVEDALEASIKGGHLNCVEYIHSILGENISWYVGYEGALNAVRRGHVHILKYFAQNSLVRWDLLKCDNAAEMGHLSCMQYLREQGCDWGEYVCRDAARGGHLSCLKYAHENGCKLDKHDRFAAARGGHFACLEYIHYNGCPWNEFTCYIVAGKGHVTCLKLLHESGCPWDSFTCSAAAQKGQLECLQYAHDHGCLWNELTCKYAAQKGQLKCLQYAHENGCPWSDRTCNAAIESGHMKCLRYAVEHGCQRSFDLSAILA